MKTIGLSFSLSPVFVAFDVLSVRGEDMRYLPVRTRGRTAPSGESKAVAVVLLRPRYRGRKATVRVACQHDLEGIVAKEKFGPDESSGMVSVTGGGRASAILTTFSNCPR